MPQIRPYENPIDTLRPSDRGAEGEAMAGRRIGAFYHQEGEELSGAVKAAADTADRFLSHQEVSHLGVSFAGTQADLTQKWNQIASDPNVDGNDPTVARKFLQEEVEPALEKLKGAPLTDMGQRFAEAHIEGIRQHFFEKTAADMSLRAGQTTAANADKVGNTYSGISFADPSSTKENLRQYDLSIRAMIATSGMNAEGAARVLEHAEKVKEQIANSGLTGLINKNPNADYSRFASDPAIAPYLKGTDPKQIQQYQQGQQRIQASLDRQAQADQRRQQTEANDDAANKLFHDHTYVLPNGNLAVDASYFAGIRDLSTRPGVRPGLPGEMLSLGERVSQNTNKVEDDPLTKALLQKEVMDQNEDFLAHLSRAAAGDKLSGKTFQELHSMWVDAQRDPEAVTGLKDVFSAARATIVNPLMPGQKDARGEQLYADFVNEVGPQLSKMNAQQRREQSDFSNPNSLVSKALASPKYARTTSDRLRDLMDANKLMSPSSPAPGPTQAQPLQPGAVMRGYKFLGGDASKASSWEKVK